MKELKPEIYLGSFGNISKYKKHLIKSWKKMFYIGYRYFIDVIFRYLKNKKMQVFNQQRQVFHQ